MVAVCFTRQQEDTKKKKRTRELRLNISFLHVAWRLKYNFLWKIQPTYWVNQLV